MKRATLLVVDDEEKTRRIMELNLSASYRLFLAENGAAALSILREEQIDIVLTDLRMPDVDGTMILKEVRRSEHPIPVIVMTAFGTIENAVALMKEGAFDYIVKPVNLDQLDLALRRAEQHVQVIRENEQLRSQLRSIEGVTKIVTASPVMQDLLKSLNQVAVTQFTVLIEGETGTGKELIARAVHELSPRAAKAFVPVNCGAIPRELLESELFGSERGAFTGATARRIGRFEQAHRRIAFSGRDRRAPPRSSGQIAPLTRGTGDRSCGRHRAYTARSPDHRGHEPEAPDRSGSRQVPRRSFLPAECGQTADPPAA